MFPTYFRRIRKAKSLWVSRHY